MDSKKFHVLSFRYAIAGIIAAIKEEPKLKFHLLTGLLVLFVSFLLNISKDDWLIIILVIGLVVSVELTNTAIEAVVDNFVGTTHTGAKLAKDISAGAVLVVAITSALIGVVIFIPYLKNIL